MLQFHVPVNVGDIAWDFTGLLPDLKQILSSGLVTNHNSSETEVPGNTYVALIRKAKLFDKKKKMECPCFFFFSQTFALKVYFKIKKKREYET